MKMTLSAKLMLGLAMTSAIMSVQAHAQDDLLFETGQVLESEQIDIDGNYNRPSAADRMAKCVSNLKSKMKT